MIYTIRATSGREEILIDILSSKIRTEGLEVKSLFHPAEIKGYVFVEGESGAIHKAMQGVLHAKGLIEKPIRFEEIQHFLEAKKGKIKLDEGDTVEIIGGPFKGEKGQIKRIDKAKDEITIELLEATIPIPVTISTEFVKILKRARPDEEAPEKPVTRIEEEPEEDERSVFDEPMKEEEPKEEPARKKKPSLHDLKKDLMEKQEEEPEPVKPKEEKPAEPKEGSEDWLLAELEKEEDKKKKKHHEPAEPEEGEEDG